MDSSIKKIVKTLCIIASILIVVGLGLTLKSFLDEEGDIFNVADDPSYHRIVFHLNGASSIENKVAKCKIGKDNSCTISLPNATKDNGFVLGYSKDANSKEAEYNIGENVTLNQSIDLYVISFKINTLTINKRDVEYVEKDKVSCKTYNEERECAVIIPNFNKIGYENKGYSTSSDSLVGFTFPYDEYKISNDTVLYPIYSTSARHKSINVVRNFTYLDSFIEVETGCRENIYNNYLKYLDEIKKYTPYMLLGNKISFITDKTFDDIWGSNYVGMNYGPRNFRSVDIRCSSNSYNDYYATMVHEMAHSWDFFYASKFGDNISNQSDLINLYNKYKNAKNRPFREYSYSSIYEFMADMMRYYYFKYYVPRIGFSNLNYPNDIKKVLEKYICISKNNYDESKCKV